MLCTDLNILCFILLYAVSLLFVGVVATSAMKSFQTDSMLEDISSSVGETEGETEGEREGETEGETEGGRGGEREEGEGVRLPVE